MSTFLPTAPASPAIASHSQRHNLAPFPFCPPFSDVWNNIARIPGFLEFSGAKRALVVTK
jgi:hypothetical protein